MLLRNFKVAMHNEIGIAPDYFRPHVITIISHEWLIVERYGTEGEMLTISDAGSSPSTAPSQAPAGLSPNNTMFGVLLHEDSANNEAVFLMVRHLPTGESVPGSFFPVDGCVRIVDCGMVMRTGGRHAHNAGGEDNPDPSPGQGFAWHFNAKRVRWVDENYSRTLWQIIRCWWPFIFRVKLSPLQINKEKLSLTDVQREIIQKRIKINLD